jgi:hypothetical protein
MKVVVNSNFSGAVLMGGMSLSCSSGSSSTANQGVLRHQRERSEDPNLDRRLTYVLVAIVRKRLGLELSLSKFYRF